MPYRRLPNTDNARLKALLKAYEKGKETPPFKLAFSQSTYRRIVSFIFKFEKKILEQKSALSNQTDRNKDYHNLQKKAKLYISHFIQVVNMAIQRGEISESILEYYHLNGHSKKLPPLNTEEELIKWGERLIEGETERIRKGMSPVTNPTIAVVKVRYEKFLEAYHNQKNLQLANNRSLKEVSDLRPEADDIILNIWNEVEDSFKDLPDDLRREKAMEYGLVYVYRKNELSDQNLFNSRRMGIS
jgi:hypothetical protein